MIRPSLSCSWTELQCQRF